MRPLATVPLAALALVALGCGGAPQRHPPAHGEPRAALDAVPEASAAEPEPPPPPPVIPNTDVEDTPENREVLLFLERYRRATEARDADAIMALVSPSYRDDAGTPSPSDDVDYAEVERQMNGLTAVAEIRYTIRYRSVRFAEVADGIRVFVEGTIQASFLMPDGRLERRLHDTIWELEPSAHGYLFLSGL